MIFYAVHLRAVPMTAVQRRRFGFFIMAEQPVTVTTAAARCLRVVKQSSAPIEKRELITPDNHAIIRAGTIDARGLIRWHRA